MTSDFSKLKTRLAELGWYHSIELPGGRTIPGLQSPDQLRTRLAQFPIPEDLRNKRVLDIGAWDGWFSFEMERRGAKVVAIDNTGNQRFREAASLLGSSVEHITADICRLHPRDLGTFHYVLFFGVLYHLKHPLLALENVCELATEAAFVESYVCDPDPHSPRPPFMEFYEGEELLGQMDNWVGPSLTCLLALCRTAGFARVQFQSVLADRAHVSCYRHWPQTPPQASPPSDADLVIVSAENAISRSTRFLGHHDEYVSIWFKSGAESLTRDEVFPSVGPYGSHPVHFSQVGSGGYLVNCKLPPGLAPGAHAVALATPRGTSANRAEIWIGAAPHQSQSNAHRATPPIRIRTVADGLTWNRDQVSLTPRGGFLSLWVENLDPYVHADAVTLHSDRPVAAASFISARLPDGLTQINFPIPSSFPPGPATLTLIVDGHPSALFHLQVLRP